MDNFSDKLKFLEEIDKMKSIKRTILLEGNSFEDDAQHSWHLAMFVWLFSSDLEFISTDKCIKIALIHDLCEMYAGDTNFLDNEGLKTKESRENKALSKLNEIYPEIIKEEFINLLDEYKNGTTKEARFVREIDKIHPILQIVLEGGNSWHEYKIDKNKLIKKKYETVSEEFGLRKVLDYYFDIAEKNGMFYDN